MGKKTQKTRNLSYFLFFAIALSLIFLMFNAWISLRNSSTGTPVPTTVLNASVQIESFESLQSGGAGIRNQNLLAAPSSAYGEAVVDTFTTNYNLYTTHYNTAPAETSTSSAGTGSPVSQINKNNEKSANYYLLCPQSTPVNPTSNVLFYPMPNAYPYVAGDICLNQQPSLTTTIVLPTAVNPPTSDTSFAASASVGRMIVINAGNLNLYNYQFTPSVNGKLSNGFSTDSYIFQSVPSMPQHGIWAWSAVFADFSNAHTPESATFTGTYTYVNTITVTTSGGGGGGGSGQHTCQSGSCTVGGCPGLYVQECPASQPCGGSACTPIICQPTNPSCLSSQAASPTESNSQQVIWPTTFASTTVTCTYKYTYTVKTTLESISNVNVPYNVVTSDAGGVPTSVQFNTIVVPSLLYNYNMTMYDAVQTLTPNLSSISYSVFGPFNYYRPQQIEPMPLNLRAFLFTNSSNPALNMFNPSSLAYEGNYLSPLIASSTSTSGGGSGSGSGGSSGSSGCTTNSGGVFCTVNGQSVACPGSSPGASGTGLGGSTLSLSQAVACAEGAGCTIGSGGSCTGGFSGTPLYMIVSIAAAESGFNTQYAGGSSSCDGEGILALYGTYGTGSSCKAGSPMSFLPAAVYQPQSCPSYSASVDGNDWTSIYDNPFCSFQLAYAYYEYCSQSSYSSLPQCGGSKTDGMWGLWNDYVNLNYCNYMPSPLPAAPSPKPPGWCTTGSATAFPGGSPNTWTGIGLSTSVGSGSAPTTSCPNTVDPGTLSFDQVYACAYNSGFRGVQLPIIISISMAESTFNSNDASGLLGNNNNPDCSGSSLCYNPSTSCSTGTTNWNQNPTCEFGWAYDQVQYYSSMDSGQCVVIDPGVAAAPAPAEMGTPNPHDFCYWGTYMYINQDPPGDPNAAYCQYMPTAYSGENCPGGGNSDNFPWASYGLSNPGTGYGGSSSSSGCLSDGSSAAMLCWAETQLTTDGGLGTPYCYGAEIPPPGDPFTNTGGNCDGHTGGLATATSGGFDCSGLVDWAAAQAGITAFGTYVTGVHGPSAEGELSVVQTAGDTTTSPVAGDLVFFSNVEGSLTASHVGICMNTGCSLMIDAPSTGGRVSKATLPADAPGGATVRTGFGWIVAYGSVPGANSGSGGSPGGGSGSGSGSGSGGSTTPASTQFSISPISIASTPNNYIFVLSNAPTSYSSLPEEIDFGSINGTQFFDMVIYDVGNDIGKTIPQSAYANDIQLLSSWAMFQNPTLTLNGQPQFNPLDVNNAASYPYAACGAAATASALTSTYSIIGSYLSSGASLSDYQSNPTVASQLQAGGANAIFLNYIGNPAYVSSYVSQMAGTTANSSEGPCTPFVGFHGTYSSIPSYAIYIFRTIPTGYENASGVSLTSLVDPTTSSATFNSEWTNYWNGVVSQQNDNLYLVKAINLQVIPQTQWITPYNISVTDSGAVYITGYNSMQGGPDTGDPMLASISNTLNSFIPCAESGDGCLSAESNDIKGGSTGSMQMPIIAASPTGSLVFLANPNNGNIYAYDGQTLQYDSTIPLVFSKSVQGLGGTNYGTLATLNITYWIGHGGIYNYSLPWASNPGGKKANGFSEKDQSKYHHPIALSDPNGYLYILDDWSGAPGQQCAFFFTACQGGVWFNILMLRAINTTGQNVPISPTYFNDMWTEVQCVQPTNINENQCIANPPPYSKGDKSVCIQPANSGSSTPSCEYEQISSCNIGNTPGGYYGCVEPGSMSTSYQSLASTTYYANDTYPPYGWILSANVSRGGGKIFFTACSSSACTVNPSNVRDPNAAGGVYQGDYAPAGPPLKASHCGGVFGSLSCDIGVGDKTYPQIPIVASMTADANSTIAILFPYSSYGSKNQNGKNNRSGVRLYYNETLFVNLGIENYTSILDNQPSYYCFTDYKPASGSAFQGVSSSSSGYVMPECAYDPGMAMMTPPISLLYNPFYYMENAGSQKILSFQNYFYSTFTGGNGAPPTGTSGCKSSFTSGTQSGFQSGATQCLPSGAPPIPSSFNALSGNYGSLTNTASQLAAQAPSLNSVITGSLVVPYKYSYTLTQSYSPLTFVSASDPTYSSACESQAPSPPPPSNTKGTIYSYSIDTATSNKLGAYIEGGPTYLQYQEQSSAYYVPNLSDIGTIINPQILFTIQTDRNFSNVSVNDTLFTDEFQSSIVNSQAILNATSQDLFTIHTYTLGPLLTFQNITTSPYAGSPSDYNPVYAGGNQQNVAQTSNGIGFFYSQNAPPPSVINLFDWYEESIFNGPLNLFINATKYQIYTGADAGTYNSIGYQRLIYKFTDIFNNTIYAPIDADIANRTVLDVSVSPVISTTNANQSTLIINTSAYYYKFVNGGFVKVPMSNGQIYLYYDTDLNYVPYNPEAGGADTKNAILCAFSTQPGLTPQNCYLSNPTYANSKANANQVTYFPSYNTLASGPATLTSGSCIGPPNSLLAPTQNNCNIYGQQGLTASCPTAAYGGQSYQQMCLPLYSNGTGTCTTQAGLIRIVTTNSLGENSMKVNACGIGSADIIAKFYGSPSGQPLYVSQVPLEYSANTQVQFTNFYALPSSYNALNYFWTPNETAYSTPIGLYELNYGNIDVYIVLLIVAALIVFSLMLKSRDGNKRRRSRNASGRKSNKKDLK